MNVIFNMVLCISPSFKKSVRLIERIQHYFAKQHCQKVLFNPFKTKWT